MHPGNFSTGRMSVPQIISEDCVQVPAFMDLTHPG